MSYSSFFFILAFVCIAFYIASSVKIVSELQKRGIKISFLWLRLYIIKYAHQYKKITQQETGQIGAPFYVWIISVNSALLCAVLGLLLR